MIECSDQHETWKPIVGYEGYYSVSSCGRIRRDAKGLGTIIGHLLRPEKIRSGYLRVPLTRNGRTKRFLVHRLVLAAFYGPCPNRYEANHRNGIKTDNYLTNLEYLTRRENARHSVDMLGNKHGCYGANNPSAKLTEKQVSEIRSIYKNYSITKHKIALAYGVSDSTIGRVILGRTYKKEKPYASRMA